MLVDKDGKEIPRDPVGEIAEDFVTGILGACIGVDPGKHTKMRTLEKRVMDALDSQHIKYTAKDVRRIVSILLSRN